jgi:hypothetical protein
MMRASRAYGDVYVTYSFIEASSAPEPVKFIRYHKRKAHRRATHCKS